MKTGFIGAGNMGGALARAVGKTGMPLLICDRDDAKAAACAEAVRAAGGTAGVAGITDVVSGSNMLLIAVKPQGLDALAEQISDVIEARKRAGGELLIVSMVAGVSVRRVSSLFGRFPVIRIMPNTPAAVGEGVILYCVGDGVSDGQREAFLGAMSSAGITEELDEAHIDAAGSLSGCGPAFVYMFIEALADGAVEAGLPRDIALRCAEQTVLGAAALAKASGKHPGELKDAVCSPGGTTIEGVRALEEAGFRAAAMNAVIAACEKTSRLANGR